MYVYTQLSEETITQNIDWTAESLVRGRQALSGNSVRPLKSRKVPIPPLFTLERDR